MERQPKRIWAMGIALILLFFFAWHLAVSRIYQVDEAQNLTMVRVLATHQSGASFTSAALWMLGPMSWLARAATDSASLFFYGRMVFLGVFILNIVLIALNTGARLRSEEGLVALLGAATLAPLWDYGFEIRHDNLILAGLLIMWWAGRTRPRGAKSYALIGFLGVVLVFVAFKSFLYVIPVTMALLAFPHPENHSGRMRLLGSWVLGAGLGLVLVAVSYGASGAWSIYVAGVKGGMGAVEDGSRFGPWMALGRTLTQMPLLVGLTVAALCFAGVQIQKAWRETLVWDSWRPEAALFVFLLGVMCVNPTPFPYNLVNLVPFAYLLAYRFLRPTLLGHGARPVHACIAGGIICFTHAVPFVSATSRHLDWTNGRQETLMNVAEALTDPTKDPVYDAIGMVPSRPRIGFHWYLHSLNIRSFQDGGTSSVTQMLKERPAAVLIPSYRTDWLPETDRQFIQSRYLPLADDFWVLGSVLPSGGGTYEAVHPGRYQVVQVQEGRIMPLPSAEVDGQGAGDRPAQLSEGMHRVTCEAGMRPVVVWVGPRLDRIPQIAGGDHRRLFVNWY